MVDGVLLPSSAKRKFDVANQWKKNNSISSNNMHDELGKKA